MTSLVKNKFKRLTFLASAIDLEREEFLILDAIYEKNFIREFAEENAYTIDCIAQELPESESLVTETNSPPNQPADLKECSSVTKSLHRELARKTHPDVSGDPEVFKTIQHAYEVGDVSTLLVFAQKFDVCPAFTIEELEELEMQIEIEKKSLGEMKNTVRWKWNESDKSDSTRVQFQMALGIDPKKFNEWKKKKREKSN